MNEKRYLKRQLRDRNYLLLGAKLSQPWAVQYMGVGGRGLAPGLTHIGLILLVYSCTALFSRAKLFFPTTFFRGKQVWENSRARIIGTCYNQDISPLPSPPPHVSKRPEEKWCENVSNFSVTVKAPRFAAYLFFFSTGFFWNVLVEVFHLWHVSMT